jgi:polygalacturonase
MGLDYALVLQAMSITGCSNVLIRNLQFVNSQQMHLAVVDSSEIQLSGLQIQAPEDSPNTDGIHIQRVQNAQIDNCVIETGWKLLISLLCVNLFIHVNPFIIDPIA